MGRNIVTSSNTAGVTTMGNESSLPLELGATFDADEIKRLGKRFKKLDLDNSGSLSVDEFMSLPELQQNPLVQRVIEIFDDDGNGEVDLKEFIQLVVILIRDTTHTTHNNQQPSLPVPP